MVFVGEIYGSGSYFNISPRYEPTPLVDSNRFVLIFIIMHTVYGCGLYLMVGWLNSGNRQNSLKLLDVEVREADGADLALIHQLLKGLPRLHVVHLLIL